MRRVGIRGAAKRQCRGGIPFANFGSTNVISLPAGALIKPPSPKGILSSDAIRPIRDAPDNPAVAVGDADAPAHATRVRRAGAPARRGDAHPPRD